MQKNNPEFSEEFKSHDFRDLSRPYEIAKPQHEGELLLADISRTSDREHVWAFDEERSVWTFYPTSSHEEMVDANAKRSYYSVKIPDQLIRPPGRSSIHYHIHVDRQIDVLRRHYEEGLVSRDFIVVNQQIPKHQDIQAAVTLCRSGYKGFRIVTPRGITRLIPDLEKLHEVTTLPGLSIEQRQIENELQKGVKESIIKCFEIINRHFGGLITLEFQPFE